MILVLNTELSKGSHNLSRWVAITEWITFFMSITSARATNEIMVTDFSLRWVDVAIEVLIASSQLLAHLRTVPWTGNGSGRPAGSREDKIRKTSERCVGWILSISMTKSQLFSVMI